MLAASSFNGHELLEEARAHRVGDRESHLFQFRFALTEQSRLDVAQGLGSRVVSWFDAHVHGRINSWSSASQLLINIGSQLNLAITGFMLLVFMTTNPFSGVVLLRETGADAA